MTKAPLEPVERRTFALGCDFHRTIWPVGYPAVDAFQPGGLFSEPAEADSLHMPPYEVSPGLEHRHSIRGVSSGTVPG